MSRPFITCHRHARALTALRLANGGSSSPYISRTRPSSRYTSTSFASASPSSVAHEVLHHACPLRSPSDPMTIRSSSTPLRLQLEPRKRPVLDLPDAEPKPLVRVGQRAAEVAQHARPNRRLGSGISTRTSISSRMPSAVNRWIWNSSTAGYSRTIASTARG